MNLENELTEELRGTYEATRIKRQRPIVEGNRELIRMYEEKTKKVIERV